MTKQHCIKATATDVTKQQSACLWAANTNTPVSFHKSKESCAEADWAALLPPNKKPLGLWSLRVIPARISQQVCLLPKACCWMSLMIRNRWIRQRTTEWMKTRSYSHNVRLICKKPVMMQLWNTELFISDLCPRKKAWFRYCGGVGCKSQNAFSCLQRVLSFLLCLQLASCGVQKLVNRIIFLL